MKQTAVEWLETILEGQKDKPFDFDEWSIAFEQAKAIEKEQIIIAHINGQSEFDKGSYREHNKKLANKYYEEVLNGSH